MGTRSRIAVMHGDNCKSVYCHWDGYLDYNGRILQEHYDSAKANHLVALGDLSSLGKSIGEKHPFSPFVTDTNEFKALPKDEQDRIKAEIQAAYDAAKEAGWSTFYARDREETGCEFKTDTTFEAFLSRVDGCCGEWYYVMREGVWYCGNLYERDTKFYKQLVPLVEALETIKETA